MDIQAAVAQKTFNVPLNLNHQELGQDHPQMSLRVFLEKMLIYKQQLK